MDSYVQEPNCNYLYSSSASWTGISSYSFISESNGILTIQSTDTNLIGTNYPVSLDTTFTLYSNGGSSTTTFVASTVSFTIYLANGCEGATLNSPSLSSTAVTLVDGTTSTVTFTDASDTYASFLNDLTYCGTRTYEVQFQSDSSTVSWISVALTSGNDYAITISPQSTPGNEADMETTHNVKLVINPPTAYASHQAAISVDFTVEVTAASGCDCNYLPWDDGTTSTLTVQVGSSETFTLSDPPVSANAYTDYAQLRDCVVDSCATTGSFTAATVSGSSLPSWITLSGSNLVIAPDDGSLKDSSPYSIEVTFTPDNGVNNPTYVALTLTVDCQITSFTISGVPTGTTYEILSTSQTLDLRPITYTQVPACGYTV